MELVQLQLNLTEVRKADLAHPSITGVRAFSEGPRKAGYYIPERFLL